MKKRFNNFLIINPKFLLISFMLTSTYSNMYAQSLIKELGGVKTDFVFTTNSTKLEVVDQAIIQRGFFDFNSRTNSSNSTGYAYGYGLQAYHLEFVTISDLITFEKYKKKATKATYNINLYNENDTLLLNFGVLYSKSKATIKTAGLTSYSINLIQVPIIIFDRVKRIDITLIIE